MTDLKSWEMSVWFLRRSGRVERSRNFVTPSTNSGMTVRSVIVLKASAVFPLAPRKFGVPLPTMTSR